MKKLIKYVLLILLAIILYVGYGITKRIGTFQSVESKLVDKCYKVTVAPGAEDIVYDKETGLAFITADNRLVPHHGHTPGSSEKIAANGIYVVDLNAEKIGQARKVSPDNMIGFRPHGHCFWKGPDGDKRLFVVNHQTDEKGHLTEVVEIFQIGEGGMLTLLESVSFPEMTNPNDVVAVGPRQFYATNYLRHHPGQNEIYGELLLAKPFSSIVYYNGSNGKIVASGGPIAKWSSMIANQTIH